MSKVYVVRCPDYDQVEERMTKLLDLMGGMGQFAAPGEKIVLKVNFLRPAAPEKAVTTHPAIVAAVGRMAKDVGTVPVIAESPGSGYPYNEKTLDRIYRVCGMYEAAQEAGIEVNFDTTHEDVSFPDGELTKRFEAITPVVEADGVFNLCKLKTHLFTGMTGAVKNNFGVIPGLAKPGYHSKLHSPERFANMLLDLVAFVSPRLSVMDAVVGMEGDGPANGPPRHIGLLLAAKSPLALDVVASEIIGLSRENNPVLIEAEKRDLYPNRLEHIDVVGADIADLRIPDYQVPATVSGGVGFAGLPWWQRKLLVPLFKEGMTLKPQIVKSKCIACRACHDACPMETIAIIDDQYARINDENCIRCYCCHEMCPQNAIDLKSSLLYRFVNT